MLVLSQTTANENKVGVIPIRSQETKALPMFDVHCEVVDSDVIASSASALIHLIQVHHAHRGILSINCLAALYRDDFGFIVVLIEVEFGGVARLGETEERVLLDSRANRQHLMREVCK